MGHRSASLAAPLRYMCTKQDAQQWAKSIHDHFQEFESSVQFSIHAYSILKIVDSYMVHKNNNAMHVTMYALSKSYTCTTI